MKRRFSCVQEKDGAVKPCRSKCGAHELKEHAHSQRHAPEIIFPIKVGKNHPPLPAGKPSPVSQHPDLISASLAFSSFYSFKKDIFINSLRCHTLYFDRIHPPPPSLPRSTLIPHPPNLALPLFFNLLSSVSTSYTLGFGDLHESMVVFSYRGPCP